MSDPTPLRSASPRETIHGVLEESDELEAVVVIAFRKDGQITLARSLMTGPDLCYLTDALVAARDHELFPVASAIIT